MEIPHFTAIWQPIDSETDNDNNLNSNNENKDESIGPIPIFTRNLFPNSKKYSQAVYEIVKSFQWKKFAIIYDSDDSLVRLQEIFPISSELQYRSHKQSIRYYKLSLDYVDYKPMLKDISKSGINQVMMDCSLDKIRAVLKQSNDVGMMNEYVVSVI